MKIRSVGPLSVGKISGAIYGGLGFLIGLVFALISLVGAAIAANQQGAVAGLPPIALGIAAIFFAPVFYGAAGFLGGVITAALYNVAARMMGGIEVELGD
jgi:hypothetical protein